MKSFLDNGINYQPQLVFSLDFWLPSTGMSARGLGVIWIKWNLKGQPAARNFDLGRAHPPRNLHIDFYEDCHCEMTMAATLARIFAYGATHEA